MEKSTSCCGQNDEEGHLCKCEPKRHILDLCILVLVNGNKGLESTHSEGVWLGLHTLHVLTADLPTVSFYINSGACAHLVPMMCSLRNYIKFVSPLENVAVNTRKVLAYGSGTV